MASTYQGISTHKGARLSCCHNNYVAHVGATIAKYQITNGGPIILLQPENEYTGGTTSAAPVYFPDPTYVEKWYRDAGIVVLFISNDACNYIHIEIIESSH
jgi:hypothetical protein